MFYENLTKYLQKRHRKSNENFTKHFQNFQKILRKLLKYVENIYIFYKNFKENYVKILKKILQKSYKNLTKIL